MFIMKGINARIRIHCKVYEHKLSFSDDDSDEASIPHKMPRQQFLFSTQGTWVAVFYTMQEGQEFFLGQVMDVINEEEGSVNFLQQCSVKETTFRFSTSSSDCDQRIHSKFIFDWDFEVTTTNGRIWTVKNIKEIRKRFRVYIRDCA